VLPSNANGSPSRALEDRERLVEPLATDDGLRRLADVAERAVVERAEPDRQDEPSADSRSTVIASRRASTAGAGTAA
jgi:hypothetical protein